MLTHDQMVRVRAARENSRGLWLPPAHARVLQLAFQWTDELEQEIRVVRNMVKGYQEAEKNYLQANAFVEARLAYYRHPNVFVRILRAIRG